MNGSPTPSAPPWLPGGAGPPAGDHACILEEEVLALLEGRLSSPRRWAIEAHVDGCAECHELLAAAAIGLAPESLSLSTLSSLEGRGLPGERTPWVLPRGAEVGERYEICEILGVGGMGVVYAALDRTLRRRVALKMVRRDPSAEASPAAAARLVREAQMLARLSHPNVVVVHDVVTAAGEVFLAMELIAGQTLREWSARPRGAGLRELVTVFIAVGRGLAAAHRAGIAHGDLKPDNVIIGDDGRPRVTDFGLARGSLFLELLEDSEDSGSSDDSVDSVDSGEMERSLSAGIRDAEEARSAAAGTPRYMAPERLAGATADASSDQFSVALALYEALHTEDPFPTTSLAARRAAILRGVPRIAGPRWLSRALARGLAADPGDRFPTMDAFCDALERGLEIRRWRRLGAGFGVGLGLLALGALAIVLRPPEVPECDAPQRLLAGTWDPAVRRELASLIADRADPRMSDAWHRLEGSLDRTAATWIERYRGACAVERRGDGDLQAHRRAVAVRLCLEESLSTLRSFTISAHEADLPTLEYLAAQPMEAQLVARCDEPERAILVEPLPEDPGRQPEVLALRQKLAEIRELGGADHLARGTEAIAALRPPVEALGYAPLLAETLHLQGILEHRRGAVEGALHTLERALAVAEASRHEYLVPMIWMELVLVDISLGRLEGARRGVARIEALLARRPQPLGSRGRLESIRAHLLRARGEHRAAIAAERGAEALYALAPDSDLMVAGALVARGNSHAALGEWADAIACYRRALALRQRHLGRSHTRVAACLHNLGASYLALGELELAEEHLREAEAIRAALGPEGALERAHVLLSLGRLAELRGEGLGARRRLREGLAIRERILGGDHLDVAEVALELGELELRELAEGRGDLEVAQSMILRAHTLRESQLGVAHPLTALALVARGEVALARGQGALAEERLEAAGTALEAVELSPESRARVAFAWARALARGGGDDGSRARARNLAERAGEIYRTLGPRGADRRREVEAWLAGEGAAASGS